MFTAKLFSTVDCVSLPDSYSDYLCDHAMRILRILESLHCLEFYELNLSSALLALWSNSPSKHHNPDQISGEDYVDDYSPSARCIGLVCEEALELVRGGNHSLYLRRR